MIKEVTKTFETAAKTVEKGEKTIGKFSKEARQLKHLQKIGAVPVKEFEALKADVKAQRCGFIAIAAIEGIRMVKGKIDSKKNPAPKPLSEEDVKAIASSMLSEKSLSEDDVKAIASSLLAEMNAIAYSEEENDEETTDDQEPVAALDDTEEENG